MKFLTENLRPAWLCGRKWELLTSSVKQMSVEPPVHTCSVNSFFGEPLPQYPWHVQMEPQPLKGLEPSMGWKEKHQFSFPLWEPVSGKSSHLPAATTAPGSLHFSGGLRWSPGSTLTAPSAHHCSASASPHCKVAIATSEFPANLTKEKTLQHLKTHSRQKKKINLCFFFSFVFKMRPVHKINSVHVPTWITSFL